MSRICLACAGLLLLTWNGCGIRQAVAQDYLVDPIHIDQLLETDVGYRAARGLPLMSEVSGDRGLGAFIRRMQSQARYRDLVTSLEALRKKGPITQMGFQDSLATTSLIHAYCMLGDFPKAISLADAGPARSTTLFLHRMPEFQKTLTRSVLVTSLLEAGQIDLAAAQQRRLDTSSGSMDASVGLAFDVNPMSEAMELLQSTNRVALAMHRGERSRALTIATERVRAAQNDERVLSRIFETRASLFCRTSTRELTDTLFEWAKLNRDLRGEDLLQDQHKRLMQALRIWEYFPWQCLREVNEPSQMKAAFEVHGNRKGIYWLQQRFNKEALLKNESAQLPDQIVSYEHIRRSGHVRATEGEWFTKYSPLRFQERLNIAGVAASEAMLARNNPSLDERFISGCLESTVDELGISNYVEGQALEWESPDRWLTGLTDDAVLVDVRRFPVFDFDRFQQGAYQWLPERYGAFILTKHEQIGWVDFGNADEIDEEISATLTVIRDPTRNPTQALNRLSERLMRPLEPWIEFEQKRRLIISPDGNTWLTPWAALTLTR
ncbi:MAG: hypothetical protein AAGD07_16770 [Planctomycetota bacterium]